MCRYDKCYVSMLLRLSCFVAADEKLKSPGYGRRDGRFRLALSKYSAQLASSINYILSFSQHLSAAMVETI
jgi:hypothetical protein